MAYYRLYFFRRHTGRIREVREFEAPHDFAGYLPVGELAFGRIHGALVRCPKGDPLAGGLCHHFCGEE